MKEINPTTIKEQQKNKAIELLQQLKIYEPYIKGDIHTRLYSY